jgi:large subunit ribosomal protein L35
MIAGKRSTQSAEYPSKAGERTNNKRRLLKPNCLLSFRLMPKPIARSKTRKSVAKRFKITARGKVLRAHSSRRHLLSVKSAKRKRRLSKAARVDETDVARIKANLPFA